MERKKLDNLQENWPIIPSCLPAIQQVDDSWFLTSVPLTCTLNIHNRVDTAFLEENFKNFPLSVRRNLSRAQYEYPIHFRLLSLILNRPARGNKSFPH